MEDLVVQVEWAVLAVKVETEVEDFQEAVVGMVVQGILVVRVVKVVKATFGRKMAKTVVMV